MKCPNWFAYLDIASIIINSVAFTIAVAVKSPFLVMLHGVFLMISVQHILKFFVWDRENKEEN